MAALLWCGDYDATGNRQVLATGRRVSNEGLMRATSSLLRLVAQCVYVGRAYETFLCLSLCVRLQVRVRRLCAMCRVRRAHVHCSSGTIIIQTNCAGFSVSHTKTTTTNNTSPLVCPTLASFTSLARDTRETKTNENKLTVTHSLSLSLCLSPLAANLILLLLFFSSFSQLSSPCSCSTVWHSCVAKGLLGSSVALGSLVWRSCVAQWRRLIDSKWIGLFFGK